MLLSVSVNIVGTSGFPYQVSEEKRQKWVILFMAIIETGSEKEG